MAALNAYYAPLSRDDFYWKMDLRAIQAACDMAVAKGMPQSVIEKIWKKQIKGMQIRDGR